MTAVAAAVTLTVLLSELDTAFASAPPEPAAVFSVVTSAAAPSADADSTTTCITTPTEGASDTSTVAVSPALWSWRWSADGVELEEEPTVAKEAEMPLATEKSLPRLVTVKGTVTPPVCSMWRRIAAAARLRRAALMSPRVTFAVAGRLACSLMPSLRAVRDRSLLRSAAVMPVNLSEAATGKSVGFTTTVEASTPKPRDSITDA